MEDNDEDSDLASYDENDDNDERKQTVGSWKQVPCRYLCVPILVIMTFLATIFGLGWLARSLTLHAVPLPTNVEQIQLLSKDSSIDGLRNGAVAADHAVCSNLGTSILIKGGNAVDAAVATALCLGVANPASSGLGGGAFLLIHSSRAHHEAHYDVSASPKFKDQRDPNFPLDPDMVTEVIDCRETAPEAATYDMFLSTSEYASAMGGLSVAVPGELRGLELAHARHGSLPWSEILEPIIQLARDGVPVSAHLASDIQFMSASANKYGEYPAIRRYLTKQDNWKYPLREGDLLRNPQLADTLSRVAQHGSKALYEGNLAEDLVKDVRAEGGILTTEDMANYVPFLRSPVYGVANGYTLVGVPPPSSGGAAVIGALRFLSGYQLPMAGYADTLSVHRTVEAMRHAFAIRMALSDPDYFANTTAEAVKDLTSGEYMENLRKITLDNNTLPLSQYGGSKWAQLEDSQGKNDINDHHEGDRRLRQRKLARPFGYLDDSGTTHISVVDKDGNAVAMTSSVNLLFGSRIFSASTGVVLGDTMDDFGNPGKRNFFGLEPSEANFIAPGKRPLSSMSPTMIFRKREGSSDDEFGKLELVVGGSGGPKIITAVLQVILNYCFLGMDLFGSVARARVHDQLLYHDGAVTTTELSHLEQGPTIMVPQRTKDALLARGHDNLLDIDYAGTVQAVAVDLESNTLSAVSDIRKGGIPAGY